MFDFPTDFQRKFTNETTKKCWNTMEIRLEKCLLLTVTINTRSIFNFFFKLHVRGWTRELEKELQNIAGKSAGKNSSNKTNYKSILLLAKVFFGFSFVACQISDGNNGKRFAPLVVSYRSNLLGNEGVISWFDSVLHILTIIHRHRVFQELIWGKN